MYVYMSYHNVINSVARLRRLAGHKPAGTFFRGFLAGCRPEAGSKPDKKNAFSKIFLVPNFAGWTFLSLKILQSWSVACGASSPPSSLRLLGKGVIRGCLKKGQVKAKEVCHIGIFYSWGTKMLKILLAIPVKYMTYKGIFKPVGDPPTGFKSKKF